MAVQGPLDLERVRNAGTLRGTRCPAMHRRMKCFCAWLVNARTSREATCAAPAFQSRPCRSRASRKRASSSSDQPRAFSPVRSSAQRVFLSCHACGEGLQQQCG